MYGVVSRGLQPHWPNTLSSCELCNLYFRGKHSSQCRAVLASWWLTGRDPVTPTTDWWTGGAPLPQSGMVRYENYIKQGVSLSVISSFNLMQGKRGIKIQQRTYQYLTDPLLSSPLFSWHKDRFMESVGDNIWYSTTSSSSRQTEQTPGHQENLFCRLMSATATPPLLLSLSQIFNTKRRQSWSMQSPCEFWCWDYLKNLHNLLLKYFILNSLEFRQEMLWAILFSTKFLFDIKNWF